MKKHLLASALLFVAVAPSASALTQAEIRRCQVLNAEFPARQLAIKKVTEERDALAEAAELAGETWENAEVIRPVNAEAAQKADVAKVTFEDAKQVAYAADDAVRQMLETFNRDLAFFNTTCTGDG